MSMAEQTDLCVLECLYLVSVDGVLLLQLALSQRLIFLLELLQLFSRNLKTETEFSFILHLIFRLRPQ